MTLSYNGTVNWIPSDFPWPDRTVYIIDNASVTVTLDDRITLQGMGGPFTCFKHGQKTFEYKYDPLLQNSQDLPSLTLLPDGSYYFSLRAPNVYESMILYWTGNSCELTSSEFSIGVFPSVDTGNDQAGNLTLFTLIGNSIKGGKKPGVLLHRIFQKIIL